VENLVTFKKTYLAVGAKSRVRDLHGASNRDRILG